MALWLLVLFFSSQPIFSTNTINVAPPPLVMLPIDNISGIETIADPRNFALFPICQCCGFIECFDGKNPFDKTPIEKCVCCKGVCTVITCQNLCCYLSLCGQTCCLLDDQNFSCGPKNILAECHTDTDVYCSCCCSLCNWFNPYTVSCLQQSGKCCDGIAKCRDGVYPNSCYLGCCFHESRTNQGCNYLCLDCGEWSKELGGEGYVGTRCMCSKTKQVQNGREFSHCCFSYGCMETYCILWLCQKALCQMPY